MGLILVFFFLSGATSLGYEIIWLRHLQVIFGSSTLAVSTVVASFMAGLSLGAFYVGRFIHRTDNLLSLYGRLEMGIGLYGVISLFLLNFSDEVFHLYAGLWVDIRFFFHFIRIIHALVILIFPTVLMGATLPVLTRWFTSRSDAAGKPLAVLYGINTLGAAFGTFITGFFMIPWYGTYRNLVALAGVNLLIGLGAVVLQRRGWAPSSERGPHPEEKPETLPNPMNNLGEHPEDLTRLQIVLFLSGTASMMFEVIWTRIMEAFVYNTVYSFTTILMAFLLGVGAGSLYFRRRLQRRMPGLRDVVRVQLLLAAFSLLAWTAFDRVLPEAVLWVHMRWPEDLTKQTLATFVGTLLVIFAPTFFMGLNFPLVTHLIVLKRSRIVRDVGGSYAITTWGNILGSLGTSLFIIPWLGLQGGYRLALFFTLLAAIMALFPRWKAVETGILILFFGWSALDSGISPYVMDSGIYARPQGYTVNPAALRLLMRRNPMGFYKEGQHAGVSVRYRGGKPILRINGKPEASLEPIDQRSQTLAAYLPLMFHLRPQQVLVIGLGGGITPASFLRDPRVSQADIVEIEPAVLQALQSFVPWTPGLLGNPKARWIIEDGRGYLNRTRKRYDIISLHLSPGITSFYTQEFYRLASLRLSRGGILVQWFHTWQTDFRDIVIALHTLASIFPHYQVFCDGPSLFILASSDPLPLQPLAWVNRLRRHPDAMRDLWSYLRITSPLELMAYRIGDEKSWAQTLKNSPIHSDSQPILEYYVAKNFYLKHTEKYILERLFRLQDTEGNVRGLVESGLEPVHALFWIYRGYLGHFIPEQTKAFGQTIQKRMDEWENRSPCLADSVRWIEALGSPNTPAPSDDLFRQMSEACGLDNPAPKNADNLLIWVGTVFHSMQRFIPPQQVMDKAYRILLQQGMLGPDDWESWMNRAIQNQDDKTVQTLLSVGSTSRIPPWRLHYWKGEWERAQGRFSAAHNEYSQAIQNFPYDPDPYIRIYQLLHTQKEKDSLMKFLPLYLERFPTDLDAWFLLAQEVSPINDPGTYRYALTMANLLATTMEEKTRVYSLANP